MDGLRALAIALVILSHITHPLPESLRLLWIVLDGHLGVTCFFVISGFLITLLLLREYEKQGDVSLKNFYVRRALRIVPAYVVYLAAIFALQCGGAVSYAPRYWLAAITYTMCFMPLASAGNLGHTWSLSVEEHYYFLWPLLVKALRPAIAVRCVLVYLLATPAIRVLIYHFAPQSMDIDYASPAQMGSIAAGCLLAFVVKGYAFRGLQEAWCTRPYAVLAAGLALIACSRAMIVSGRLAVPFSDPLSAAGFAIVLVGLLHVDAGSLLSRLLNSRLAVLAGVLSYSLYLWQQPFTNSLLVGTLSWQVRLLCLFIVAGLSYLLIERPFLRLKGRFS